MHSDWIEDIFETIVLVLEAIGVATLLVGFTVAAIFALRALLQGRGGSEAFHVLRKLLGASILLGLEVLVAADLIHTIRSPSLEEAATLAIIVAIRTVLSISIQIEIDGVVPWKRALVNNGGSAVAQVVSHELSTSEESDQETNSPDVSTAADTPN